MHRTIQSVLLAVLALTAGACNSSTPVSTTTAPASLAAAVDHFTGTLTQNGALTFPFSVSGGGTVTAIVDAVTPDSAVPIGVSLGTWNGTICQIILSNDQAVQGSSVTGSVGTAGNLCLRIYDVGKIARPQTFAVEVGHP